MQTFQIRQSYKNTNLPKKIKVIVINLDNRCNDEKLYMIWFIDSSCCLSCPAAVFTFDWLKNFQKVQFHVFSPQLWQIHFGKAWSLPRLPVGVFKDPLVLVSSRVEVLSLGKPPGLVVVALFGQLRSSLPLSLLQPQLSIFGFGNVTLLKCNKI